MRILVTRPQPDADATAARLVALGHKVVVDPMLAVEPITEARLGDGPFDAVALTSVNGARALARRPELAGLLGLPLFAVGWRTASVAPPGFSRVVTAEGTGASLAVHLRDELPAGARVVHVAGQDRAVDLGEALAADGIAVALFVIYRAVAAAGLGAEAASAIREGRIDAALHFAPRTAATLVEAARRAGCLDGLGRMAHLCFSDGVARPLREAGMEALTVREPTEEALFALLEWVGNG